MARPTAVHFGAGSIGRGFLGQLLCDAGYEVVFVDVQPDLIAALNERRRYPLRFVSAEEQRTVEVGPVRAVDGRDSEAVAGEVARAGCLSTAVGAGALPHIAGPLADGLARRSDPVTLLICENLPDPAGTFRDLLSARGGRNLEGAFGKRIGLAPCVVSRMVPVPDPTLLRDPLEVIAEPYARLPVDAAGIVGPPPPIPGLEPKENFPAYVRLKLYVHNAGHAAAAYHAFPRGCTYIHEAMEDPYIASEVDGVMREGCAALHCAEGLDEAYLTGYREDLLHRFRNPHLGDTVARVARDPARKLAPEDRLIGAAKTALAHGIPPEHLARALAAALRFHPEGDPSASRIQKLLEEGGPLRVLRETGGLPEDHPLTRMVLRACEEETRGE
ncbi:MAG: mannitol-1-phosphate 5-dehydrogenase [Armatimonadetes bacterium]|nr:mannitol-1-phosphate 5-dehydrogenase [Armatimonadota bacterium]